MTISLTVIALLFVTVPCSAQSAKLPFGDHPTVRAVGMALEISKSLGLNEEQTGRLKETWTRIRGFQKEAAETLSRLERHQYLLEQAGANAQSREEIRLKRERIETKAAGLMEHAQQELARILTPQQELRLDEFLQEQSGRQTARRLTLENIMESRERLRITPQQFTRLQYLQSDFLREYAPVREEIELLRAKSREEFVETGLPSQNERYQAQMENLERTVGQIREKYAQMALEVLTPEQRERLRLAF